ncbi:MAG: endonuclease III domain-containing protein [Planctomycetota bacterium]
MKIDGKTLRRIARIDEILSGLFGDPEIRGPHDPLDTLVLTILSQNTNDTNRDRAYASLRDRFPTWKSAAKARPERIASAIRVGGLANQKGRHILGLLKWAKERFGGYDLTPLESMGDDEIREILSPLPGIGPKTLSIVMLFSLGREAFPLDTHCLRILTRLNVLPRGISALKAHEMMGGGVREGRALPFHLNLIRFGRERCRARTPDCAGCPLKRLCVFEGKV